MKKKDLNSLLQIENRINILRYHIELLLKILPQFLKENLHIRKSIANEINLLCTNFEKEKSEKKKLINEIKKNEKVNS